MAVLTLGHCSLCTQTSENKPLLSQRLSQEMSQTTPITYLEGQGDLVSRLIAPITHIVTLLTPILNLLTKSP